MRNFREWMDWSPDVRVVRKILGETPRLRRFHLEVGLFQHCALEKDEGLVQPKIVNFRKPQVKLRRFACRTVGSNNENR